MNNKINFTLTSRLICYIIIKTLNRLKIFTGFSAEAHLSVTKFQRCDFEIGFIGSTTCGE